MKRTLVGAAAALVLALVLGTTSATAVGASGFSMRSESEALLGLPPSSTLQGAAYAVSLPAMSGQEDWLDWNGEAASAYVKIITQRSEVFVGTVNDGRVERETTHHNFTNAKLRVVELGPDPPLVIFSPGLGAKPMQLDGRSTAPASLAFRSETDNALAVEGALRSDPWTPDVVSVSNIQMGDGWDDGRLTLRGDLVLRFFQISFEVKADDGPHQFFTGHRYTNTKGGSSLTPAGLVATSERSYAEIVLQDAILVVSSGQRSVRISFADLQFEMTGLLEFQALRAEIQRPAERIIVLNANVRLDAESLNAEMRPVEGVLDASFEGYVRSAWVDDSPVISPGPAATLETDAYARTLLWALPVLLLLSCAVAALAYARRHSIARAIREPADALLAQEDYSSLFQVSRERLRANPADTEAVTLHAVTLQKMNRPLESIEFLRTQLDDGAISADIAHLLCSLGHFQAGQDQEGADELERALRKNPLLAGELQDTDLLERAKSFPHLRRLLRVEQANISYG